MSLYGVHYRMEDGTRRTPFRNQPQIVVSKTCMTYSTRPMAGETKRTQLPIQWHGDTEFSVDWRPVNWRWGKAATFRAHNENGERGLEEQGKHFWRFQSAAAQNVQDNQGSHQARKSLLFLSCAFGLRPDTQLAGALLYNMHGQLEVL